jgi:hypothetical protein
VPSLDTKRSNLNRLLFLAIRQMKGSSKMGLYKSKKIKKLALKKISRVKRVVLESPCLKCSFKMEKLHITASTFHEDISCAKK